MTFSEMTGPQPDINMDNKISGNDDFNMKAVVLLNNILRLILVLFLVILSNSFFECQNKGHSLLIWLR